MQSYSYWVSLQSSPHFPNYAWFSLHPTGKCNDFSVRTLDQKSAIGFDISILMQSVHKLFPEKYFVRQLLVAFIYHFDLLRIRHHYVHETSRTKRPSCVGNNFHVGSINIGLPIFLHLPFHNANFPLCFVVHTKTNKCYW